MWILVILLATYIMYEKVFKNNSIEKNRLNGEIKENEIDTLDSSLDGSKNEVDMSNLPFQMAFSVLTKAELEFYNALKQVIDLEKQVICPKVRLLDILWVKTYVKNKQSFLNRVNRKHLDFVICEANNLKPLYAIELDDKTHEQEKRKERDEFVDILFANLNFKVIRIKCQLQYDIEKLRNYLNEELKKECLK